MKTQLGGQGCTVVQDPYAVVKKILEGPLNAMRRHRMITG
jgi:hypothetical protein